MRRNLAALKLETKSLETSSPAALKPTGHRTDQSLVSKLKGYNDLSAPF